MPANEQRHFTRIPFQADATLFSPAHKKTWPCALLDISLKGLKVSRPLEWHGEKHDHLVIELQLAPPEIKTKDVKITIQTEVVHIGKTFIGMENSYIDVDSATHLHRLIELNLGNSDMLKREYEELIALKD